MTHPRPSSTAGADAPESDYGTSATLDGLERYFPS